MTNRLTIFEGAALGAGLKIALNLGYLDIQGKPQNTPTKKKSYSEIIKLSQCAIAGGALAYALPIDRTRIQSSMLKGGVLGGVTTLTVGLVTMCVAESYLGGQFNEKNIKKALKIIAAFTLLGGCAGCIASTAVQIFANLYFPKSL